MERHQELYGAREPSDEMKASIHAHFYEQIKELPRLEAIVQWYELSTTPPGTGMRSCPWFCTRSNRLWRGTVGSWQFLSMSRPSIPEIDRLALEAE
eukprot:9253199-Pyramimonas_sp.AAC.1